MYLGDITPGKTIDFTFNTRAASGAPITLAGTPEVRAYNGSSTTEDADGITLTVDFDGVTGLNRVAVDTSADGTFYAAGSNIRLVVSAGTVDGVSVVGTTLAEFSIANRSALRPSTADRTLAVDGSGQATVGAVANNAITQAAIQDGAITNAKLADNAINAAKLADNALTAAKIAADAITSAKLADGAIAAAKIADGAISSAKFTIGTVNLAATGILERISMMWRRLFKGRKFVKTTSSNSMIDLADDGTTALATQTVTTTIEGSTETDTVSAAT